ncbi:MAG: OB-fold nucleic acid binding domain-containing protein, partial [Chloroflexota bacterium]|nr:OB-fold nucleic acid binding domain-containing protein [Chloroflexota bacterium]
LEPSAALDGKPVPIRFGLAAIKNVGSGPIRAIVAARREQPESRFRSIEHLCQVVDSRLVNRRVLESLIKAGALDEFGTRSQMLAVLDEAMSLGQRSQRASGAGQMSLFGGQTSEPEYVPSIILPAVADTPRDEQLAWEKEMLGIYITEHPLTAALSAAQESSVSLLSDLGKEQVGQLVNVIGMLTNTRVLTTKKKQSMLVGKLEDLTGSVDFVAFPEAYERHRELLSDDAILQITGKLDERNDSLQLICESARQYTAGEDEPAEELEEAREVEEEPSPDVWQREEEKSYELRILLPVTEDPDADIEVMRELERVLRAYPGDERVTLQLRVGFRSIVVEPHSLGVSISAALEAEMERVLRGRTWRVLEVPASAGEHRVA